MDTSILIILALIFIFVIMIVNNVNTYTVKYICAALILSIIIYTTLCYMTENTIDFSNIMTGGKPNTEIEIGDKSMSAALCLNWFFGTCGVDRFYLGHTWSGLAKLLTCGGLGCWVIIDMFLIISGNLKDSDGKALR